MSVFTAVCGHLLCTKGVNGIYCKEHRAVRLADAEHASALRSDRMRSLWAEKRDEMLEAIKTSREAAKEGK